MAEFMNVMDETFAKGLYDGAIYWKNKQSNYSGYHGCVFIFIRSDERVNKRVLSLLPFLMSMKRYQHIHVMSDEADVLAWVRNHMDDEISSDYELCTTDQMLAFCRIQNALKLFSDIYINVSTEIEDADALKIVGCGSISLDDVISQVFFRLDITPDENENEKFREGICSVKRYQSENVNKLNWSSLRNLLPMDRDEYATMKDFLISRKDYLKSNGIINERSKVVIYGDTKTAEECIDVFYEYNIMYIADRDSEKWGESRKGVTIISPDKAIEYIDGNVLFFVTTAYYKEPCEWLVSKGLVLGRHVHIFNYKYDMSDEPDSKVIEILRASLGAGSKVYDKLRREYPNELLLISPWNASGDIYVCGLYLREYIEKNSIGSYKIIVCNHGARKIAGLFGFKAVYITEKEAYDLLTFARLAGFRRLNILNINVNVKNQRVGNLLRFADFNTFHQKLVFGFEEKRITSGMRQENSEELFRKYKLKMGMTALIAPYSATLGRIDERLCQEMVRMLAEKGYTVCTNISGDERPLPNTTGIFIPYECVLDFVNKAGLFIGMRSGLCDVVSATDARMVIFYPKTHFNYFSLQSMGLKQKDILEMVMEDDTENGFIKRIDDFLRSA